MLLLRVFPGLMACQYVVQMHPLERALTFCQPSTRMSLGYQVPTLRPRKNSGATISGAEFVLSQAAHQEYVLLAMIIRAHEDIIRRSTLLSAVRDT